MYQEQADKTWTMGAASEPDWQVPDHLTCQNDDEGLAFASPELKEVGSLDVPEAHHDAERQRATHWWGARTLSHHSAGPAPHRHPLHEFT